MKRAAILGFLAVSLMGTLFAQEGPVPKGVPHLDHVFIIMMENHGYNQLIHNPNAPFIDKYARSANLATNYFAIAHPSLTNYLEVVGGSNFGVQSDNSPDWHNASCTTNLASGIASTDNPPSPNVCPISGVGTDAATPAIDCTNEVQCTAGSNDGENNIDGKRSIAADSNIVGKTIADQLVAAGLSWKSYQESLPLAGPDMVADSDGVYTDTTDFTKIKPILNPPLTQADLVDLYAVKHNPFVYFANVQEGENPRNSYRNVAAFDGKGGLYANLGSGDVPNYSFIAPNQCNDEHGRGNAGAFCQFDPNDDGMQDGLNPALIYRGDVAVQTIVSAIHRSPAWAHGRNAIVLLWDEDDYSVAPTINKVVFVVDTNYGFHGLQTDRFYTHFSLLKTIEGAFRLPCLNHACDSSVNVIDDLFAGLHEGQ
jgi:hypothetical protein